MAIHQAIKSSHEAIKPIHLHHLLFYSHNKNSMFTDMAIQHANGWFKFRILNPLPTVRCDGLIILVYVVWYHVVCYHVVWYHVVWYHVVWYHVVCYHVVCYHVVWYHVVWYHVVWYHVVWYHCRPSVRVLASLNGHSFICDDQINTE